MREDELNLFPFGGAGVQTVTIKRGSFQLHPAALSYVNVDDVESGGADVSLSRRPGALEGD